MQLSTGMVAQRLGVSSERVRQLYAQGVLAATSTPLGKLFDADRVDELAEERRRHGVKLVGAGTPDAA